jgi:opacity protein-like surface antigen
LRAAEPGAYFNFDAGVNLPQETEVTVRVPALGSARGDLEFDPGFRFGLEGGYRFSEMIGLGLETGFIYNELKSTDTRLMHVPILANLVFRFENSSPVVPFIGVGAGGTVSMIEGEGDSDSDVVPAWQGLAGLQFKLSDAMSAGITYKYLGINSPEFEDDGGAVVEFDTIHNHSILASLNWSF